MLWLVVAYLGSGFSPNPRILNKEHLFHISFGETFLVYPSLIPGGYFRGLNQIGYWVYAWAKLFCFFLLLNYINKRLLRQLANSMLLGGEHVI